MLRSSDPMSSHPWSCGRRQATVVWQETGYGRWLGVSRFVYNSRKKTPGYHGQARVENAFFRYKSIIGDSLRACSPAGRRTEVDLACNILNQMTGLGRPMSCRIGR